MADGRPHEHYDATEGYCDEPEEARGTDSGSTVIATQRSPHTWKQPSLSARIS